MYNLVKSVVFLILLEQGLGVWEKIKMYQPIMGSEDIPLTFTAIVYRRPPHSNKANDGKTKNNIQPLPLIATPKAQKNTPPLPLISTPKTKLPSSLKSIPTIQPVERDTCKLFDTFGKIIQGVCGVFAFTSLIIKRHREKNRRSWSIWVADVSKQLASSGAAHLVAIFTANLVSSHSANISACSWYLVAFMIDVSFGVSLSLFLLKIYTKGLKRCAPKYKCVEQMIKSGEYEQKLKTICGKKDVVWPNWWIWFTQMSLWTFGCVVPARLACTTIVYSFRKQLKVPAAFIAIPFARCPKLELVFVMLAGPLLLNGLQYVVQDGILKFSQKLIQGEDPEDKPLIEKINP